MPLHALPPSKLVSMLVISSLANVKISEQMNVIKVRCFDKTACAIHLHNFMSIAVPFSGPNVLTDIYHYL